jgi:hypothetical protein
MPALDLQYKLINGPPRIGAAYAAVHMDVAVFVWRFLEGNFVRKVFFRKFVP